MSRSARDIPDGRKERVIAQAKARGIKTLVELEEHAIREALEAFNGNVLDAAIALDMGRATIYRRLAEMGLRQGKIGKAAPL